MAVDLIVPTINPEYDNPDAIVVYNGNDEFIGRAGKLISIHEPIGFNRAANIGLSYSTAQHVALLNDDAEPKTENWMLLMAEACTGEIAGVGPATNASCYQGRIERNRGFTKVPKAEINLDGFGIGNFFLSFFCVILQRLAIEDVGLFDKRFDDGYGGMEDDWIARAELNGWRFGVHTDVMVLHESHRTYGRGKRLSRMQRENVQRLREKWSQKLTSKA